MKDSIYYFLLGPAYSVIYPVKIAIDSYSFATGSYSRKGDKLSVGLMAEGSAVANFVLNNNGTNENVSPLRRSTRSFGINMGSTIWITTTKNYQSDLKSKE